MRKHFLIIGVFVVVTVGGVCSYAQTVLQSKRQAETPVQPEQTAVAPVAVQPETAVADAENTVEAAQKEVELQKKIVDLEKKKAEVIQKEAEAAKSQAELLKDMSVGRKELQQALTVAQEKEKEAVTALKKVRLAEDQVLIAQEKAHLVQEEMKILAERARIAEEKIRRRQNVFYQKLLQTFLIVLIGYLLIPVSVRIVNKKVEDIKVRHIVRTNVVYVINFLIVVAVVIVWVKNLSSITIFFSVLGAGVALALQEVILCLAGWFLILVRRPFEVGDRIELGGVKGDVIDVRPFQTLLLEVGNWVGGDQSTGRIVDVPNSNIFKHESYNYNRGFEFIWDEISVVVTFESDWKRGEQIMLEHGRAHAEGMEEVVRSKIRNMARRYMIYYDKLTPIAYTSIKDSGVALTLRYLTEAKKRRETHDAICRAILDDFAKEPQVNFAYITYRIVQK